MPLPKGLKCFVTLSHSLEAEDSHAIHLSNRSFQELASLIPEAEAQRVHGSQWGRTKEIHFTGKRGERRNYGGTVACLEWTNEV